jgi:hypothetical protein
MWPRNMAIGYREGMRNRLKVSSLVRAGLFANLASPLLAIAIRMDDCIAVPQFARI